MSQKSKQLLDREILIDRRKFPFGSIWVIKDNLIVFPAEDRIGVRKLHNERWVVVVSNSPTNHSPHCPVVTVAPLTSRVDIQRKFDLRLYKGRDNVKMDSLIKLQHMQPALKIDLKECKGEISDDAKDELYELISEYFGFTLYDDL